MCSEERVIIIVIIITRYWSAIGVRRLSVRSLSEPDKGGIS